MKTFEAYLNDKIEWLKKNNQSTEINLHWEWREYLISLGVKCSEPTWSCDSEDGTVHGGSLEIAGRIFLLMTVDITDQEDK